MKSTAKKKLIEMKNNGVQMRCNQVQPNSTNSEQFLTWAILKGVSLSVQSKFGMDFGFVVNIDAAVVVLDPVENSANVDALSMNVNIFL